MTKELIKKRQNYVIRICNYDNKNKSYPLEKGWGCDKCNGRGYYLVPGGEDNMCIQFAYCECEKLMRININEKH